MNTPRLLKSLWREWTHLAHRIGNFQARVLLTLLYAMAIFPFGVAVRLLADPLRIKVRPSNWHTRPLEENDLEWARRQ
jgi:hypothetical protein